MKMPQTESVKGFIVEKIIHYQHCPLCASKNIGLNLAIKDYSISQEAFEIYECADCSFHFTQNVPSPASITPYYKSDAYISHNQNKEGLVHKIYHYARTLMLNRKKRLIQKLTKGNRLLDVGSGIGYFLGYMYQHGYEVEGIEIDEDARRATKNNFGIEVAQPAALLNEEPTRQVDIVTMWHVLEHLHDMNAYMTSIHKKMKKEAFLLIAVPNHTSYDAQYYGKYWAAYDVPRHLWHFSPKTIARLAHQTGFEVIDQKRLPLDPFYNSFFSERHKSNKLSFIFGAIIGLISYLVSIINPSRTSSPVYILKKIDLVKIKK